MYDFSHLRQKIADTRSWLQKEYTGIRTSRAAPVLLDTVIANAYGSRVPLNQLASIAVEDARTLRVTPWDVSSSKDIEKAIVQANLGVSVSVDERGLRVSFPELTGERRTALVKLARDRLEDARIALRTSRDDTWSDIQAQEHSGAMSEDDKFRAKDEMQKLVDEGNRALEILTTKKEEEITI
jgi:ribosome recycling factor